MIRGNRLVIPVQDYERRHEIMWGGGSFAMEDVPRMELSLFECEAILSHLPIIVEYVIRERPKKEAEKK